MTLIKILHLLALMFGSVAALGNLYVGLAKGPHDLDAPGYTNTLRKMFRFTSLGAIIILWASGVILLLANFGGAMSGTAFHIKLLFVIILTSIIFFMNFMSPGWARRSGPPSYVPALHWIGASCLILVVIFAGIAFG